MTAIVLPKGLGAVRGRQNMEYWEFLLQKEGDQAWLPLEASEVEILEGRYRLMAHTSHGEAPIDIQISQWSAIASGRRRVLKRQGMTNQNGLMVIMPFTWLQQGTWEIHCAMAADTAEAAANPKRQYAVQLQILSQDSPTEDDWITDPWARGEPAPVDRRELLSDAALAVAFQSIDQALAETVTNQETQAARGLRLSSQYCIELAQSALVARQGSLTVVGQVVAAPEVTFPSPTVVALRLLDPQTGQTLTTHQQPVNRPSSMAIPISLPRDLETQLLLGEVALITLQGQVLAVQRFTVTVDLSSLIDAIANQAESFDEFDIVFPDGESVESEEEPRPASYSSPPPRAIPILLPREGESLPPKIYYPSPHEVTVHEPALPPLRGAAPAQPRQPETSSANDSNTASEQSAAANDHPSAPKAPQLPSFASPANPPVPPLDEALAPATAPAPTHPTPTAPDDFQTLNLQERFWLRLNALAVENHQAALQRQANLQAEMNPPPVPPATEEGALSASPFSGEFVVYEDEADLPAAAPIEPPEPEQTGQHDPISPPTPVIDLPADDLVAGDALPITVRVPIHFNRVYLKLWITDPQTRTLADQPRQLMHLSPDGFGNLSAAVQLTVPEGCLEAQIEAIAVDMVTQQESYKASIRRSVVPDDVKKVDGL